MLLSPRRDFATPRPLSRGTSGVLWHAGSGLSNLGSRPGRADSTRTSITSIEAQIHGWRGSRRFCGRFRSVVGAEGNADFRPHGQWGARSRDGSQNLRGTRDIGIQVRRIAEIADDASDDKLILSGRMSRSSLSPDAPTKKANFELEDTS